MAAPCSHNPNLAEGLPVDDALFAVEGGAAKIVADGNARIANGGFEDHQGNKLTGYRFHDQPGEVSFVDTQVRHGGRLR